MERTHEGLIPAVENPPRSRIAQPHPARYHSSIPMSEVMTKPEPTHKSVPPADSPAVEVFAVYGVEPEVQAYAMAKYSRSALSMKEALKEITAQKAEKFLNTFYFQYGHRSIADLAQIG